MKILHLCLSSFYIDNFSYQENMLPKYHVIMGHDVTVIASLVSFDLNGKPCLLDSESVNISNDGYKVIRLDYKRFFYNFFKFIRIYNNTFQAITNESPDLIFIHDFSFMDIFSVIRYVRKKRDVKVYVDCHTDFINSAQSWVSKYIFHYFIWMLVAKLLSPYVEKFYGVTPLRCDFLRDVYRINPHKVELLVMGVDDYLVKTKKESYNLTILINKFNFSSSDFIIVTGGKIDQKKNIHLVMKAIISLNISNIKLIIFGTVATELKEQFEDLVSKGNFIYVGWLNSNQILDYILLAHLVVFPGTHSVLWEQAVGSGVPCVFKYWHGMDHVDFGGNCKFLYNDSVEEIENVLKTIVLNLDVYSNMKKQSSIALENFSYSRIAYRSINFI
jgi:1,2-diacylglycerol 3-alpha-glucosyltransferase